MQCVLTLLLALSTFLSAQALQDITYTFKLERLNSQPLNQPAIAYTHEYLKASLQAKGMDSKALTRTPENLHFIIKNINPNIADKLVSDLIRPFSLTIHEVHPESQKLAPLVQAGTIATPDDYEIKMQPLHDKDGEIIDQKPVLVKIAYAISNIDIHEASPDFQTKTAVNVTLTHTGAAEMKKFTSTLTKGKLQIATLLNGTIISIVTLQADTLSKHFQISGLQNFNQCKAIAFGIKPPQPVDIKILKRTATPTKK